MSPRTAAEPHLAADGAAERAVLIRLLDAHPRALSLAELGEAGETEALRRAVANLAAARLIEAGDDLLTAAPAAVRIDRLALQPA